MKVVEQTINVEMSGDMDSYESVIENSPHAFRVLCDKIYKDKISSVVRETIANAYDAHVRAGNVSTPFVVKTPTLSFPFFVTRDFGTGLTKDEILNKHQRIFKSDKGDTNQEIGCFGLGAKVPYAVVNSFQVKSYLNGMCYPYVMQLNSRSIPSTTPMPPEPTTEPNGVEVIVPVKTELDKWESAIEFYCQYFAVTPIVDGINIEKREPLFKAVDGSWEIYGFTDGSIKACMGCIPYRISSAMSLGYSNIYHDMFSWDMVIRFNIGDFSVTATREDVEYSQSNKLLFDNKLREIAKQLNSQVVAKYAELPLYDAMSGFNLTALQIGKQELLGDFYHKKYVKDKSVSDNRCVINVNFPGLVVKCVKKKNSFRKRSGIVAEEISWFSPLPSPYKVLFLDDVKRGGLTRVKEKYRKFAKERMLSAVIRNGKNYTVKYYVFKFQNDNARDTFFNNAGLTFNHFRLVSELPPPNKPYRYTASTDGKTEAGVGSTRIQKYDTETMVLTNINYKHAFKYRKVFVPIDRLSLAKSFANIVQIICGKEKQKELEIYGVYPSMIAKAEKANWIRLDNYIQDWLINHKDNLRPYIEKHNITQYDGWNRSPSDKTGKNIKLLKVDNNNKFIDLLNQYVECVGNLNYSDVYDFMHLHAQNVLEKIQIETPSLTEAVEKLSEKYPMLKIVNECMTTVTGNVKYLQSVVDYMEIVDKCTNTSSQTMEPCISQAAPKATL